MNSEIILVKNINVDKNYNNVLSYTTNDMISLCRNNQIASKNDYSFIRNKGSIQTDFSYSDCIKANYIAFQNKDYSNKWFFAFIDKIEFKGENCTDIYYTVDSWSTFYDDWSKKPCYVIREHVSDDSVGLHTVPENLDIGDLISDKREYIHLDEENFFWTIVASNYNPTTKERYAGVVMQNGIPQGSCWFAFKVYYDNPNITALNDFIYNTANDGHSDDIMSMFAIPR